MASCGSDRRRHERYYTGPTEPIYYQFRDHGWRQAAVLDESYSGCSIVVEEADEVEVGETICLDFGLGFAPEAQIMRVIRISAQAVQLGCHFIL